MGMEKVAMEEKGDDAKKSLQFPRKGDVPRPDKSHPTQWRSFRFRHQTLNHDFDIDIAPNYSNRKASTYESLISWNFTASCIIQLF